jgi:hypothetical protein
MFGLFRRTHARVGSQGRASLGLEALERRDQPSANPMILGLSEEQINPGQFLVSGTVSDGNPGNLVVTFSGVPALSGQSAVTNADGSFSALVQLISGTVSGNLTAITVDGQGLVSQAAQVYLAPTSATTPAAGANTAPEIVGFQQDEVNPGEFVISGTVVDGNPGNLVVKFGGTTSASGTTVTTKADGSFSCTVQLRVDGSDCGYLTATTTDGQGLLSPMVQVYLKPTISSVNGNP